jgi:hypothetical protein
MSERLPNFVVVGAPKCGTTSLYHYLGQHPQIFLPARKELHYFSFGFMEKLLAGPGDANILKTSCRTFEEYAAYYAPAREQSAVGDISPSYFYFTDVCEEIRARLGSPKIIVMLRDPVQKAFSQYMHLIRDGRETLGLNAALAEEPRRIERGYAAMWRYAESSLYTARTRRFLDEFGRDRVKVILFDDLLRDPAGVLASTFEFLGVDPSVQVQTESVYNRSGVPRSRWMASLISKPNVITSIVRSLLPVSLTGRVKDALQRANTGQKLNLDPRAREYLRSYFQADLADLEALLGRPLAWRAEPERSGVKPKSIAEG